jgi:hypothetical protein
MFEVLFGVVLLGSGVLMTVLGQIIANNGHNVDAKDEIAIGGLMMGLGSVSFCVGLSLL